MGEIAEEGWWLPVDGNYFRGESMSTMVVATTKAQLAQLAGTVHDMWFDVDQVSLDHSTRVLRVRLFDESRKQNLSDFRRTALDKQRRRVLEIHTVSSYTLRESEGVGTYDVNLILFDEGNKLIEFRTGIPLLFQVCVTELDVRLKEDVQ